MASWWLVAAVGEAERKVQITMELTSSDSLDNLCPHLHSLDGSVLTMIWHRWRHRCLDVYSRCSKAIKHLSCNSRDKSICMLFFSVLWQRNLGTTTEKSGQTRSVGGCRRRGKCHKQLSARMCSQLWSPVALCCSCSAHGHSFYPPRTALRVLQGKLSSWMSGWAPWGNKPLTWSDLSIRPQTICPWTTLTSAGTTSLDHSWCAPKQEHRCSPFRDPSGDPSGHPLHIFATSIGENCTAELIQLYKRVLLLRTDLFSSHTSPIARFTQWPHKLLLWTRDVFLNSSTSLRTCWVPASTHLTQHS